MIFSEKSLSVHIQSLCLSRPVQRVLPSLQLMLKICIHLYFQSLEATGIRRTDPRLATLMKHLKKLQKEAENPSASISGLQLGRRAFKE